MDFDPILLARVQFAFTVAFHIVFPAFTIGLSAWIATLLAVGMWTGDTHYRDLARFWTKIFAVSFAMGVVSGIVLSYQFGTNWSRFAEVSGNVIGPLIGYEVLTAFFLEATFLGVMLFGWNRVPPWLHLTSAILVAIGTTISAFWILSANSWMHTPAGFELRDGVAFPTDWLAVIFNPSFPYRLTHMVTAAFITTGFVVLAAGARYWVQGRDLRSAEIMMKMSLGMLIVLTPLQAVIGDLHGINTLEHQPAKVAAMEAHWNSEEPGALVLFAIPNAETQSNDYELAIPNLGSLILTHEWDGRFDGLDAFAEEDIPPILPVFFAFRIMVGLGLLMIALSWFGAFKWMRGRLTENGPFLWVTQHMWPIGFVAILAGWFTTEIGRQPWVAQGIMRTVDATSPITPGSVVISLILFVLVYSAVFGVGVYYINRLLNRGPHPEEPLGDDDSLANRPISAAHPSGRRAMEPGV